MDFVVKFFCQINVWVHLDASVEFFFGCFFRTTIWIIIFTDLQNTCNHQPSVMKWGRKREKQVEKEKIIQVQASRQGRSLRSTTAVTARSDSSLRKVHSVSLLKLLLFSQETGSCPLPAQRITSCRLSDSGRLFVLERLPPKQKPGLINDKREKDKLCVNVCQAEEVKVRADPRQGWDMLFENIWFWFHLHVTPAVTKGPMSIHHRLLWSYDWVLTCLRRVTHLPSWFLSMTSNCFLSHLQGEGWRKKTWD